MLFKNFKKAADSEPAEELDRFGNGLDSAKEAICSLEVNH